MRKLLLLILLLIPSIASAGTNTTNGYFYLPDVGAYGADEHTLWINANEGADTQIEANKDAAALNTTHRSSNGTDHSYIDQDVTSGSTPTFTGTNITAAATATAFVSNPTDCSAGDLANAIDASGNLSCVDDKVGTLTNTKWCSSDGSEITCTEDAPTGTGDLLADGTVPLTANWDVGAYTITGTQFVSDIAIGTSPFVVTSTTVVTNLNADTVDGESASAFEDADAAITKTDEAETITANWVNTANPWADNEIASSGTWNALVTESTTAGRSLTLSTYSVEADAELYTESKAFVLETPTDDDSFIFWKVPLAITITDIDCIVGAATSAIIDIQECASDGTTCATVDAAITCDADGAADDGTFSNGGIDAGDWLLIDVGTVTGTVGYVAVTITYTKND